MATYSDLELWAVVSAICYDRNELVTYPTGETRGHVQEAVTGLQAELLHADSNQGRRRRRTARGSVYHTS